MNRIAQADLDLNFEVYVSLLKRLDMPTEGLALIGGSKLYGVSFQLVYIEKPSGGRRPAPGTYDGFMGYTKREVYERLRSMIRIMADIVMSMEG